MVSKSVDRRYAAHLSSRPLAAADRITGAGVDKGPRGEEKPSDHTHVWVELADPA